MNYPHIEFRSTKQITVDEGCKLFDMVIKYQPHKILIVGTLGGYPTLWVARAIGNMPHYHENMIMSVDYKRDLNPKPIEMLVLNQVADRVNLVECNNKYELHDVLQKHVDIDMCIFVELHNEIKELWEIVQNNINDKCVVIIHCAECEPAELMQSPILFNELIGKFEKHEILHTEDTSGFANSFGILVNKKLEKKKEQLEQPKEEIVIKEKIKEEPEIEQLSNEQENVIKEEVKEEIVVKEEEPTIATIEPQLREETSEIEQPKEQENIVKEEEPIIAIVEQSNEQENAVKEEVKDNSQHVSTSKHKKRK